jgi:glycosyltransferase involved in cell wall biosynthesis
MIVSDGDSTDRTQAVARDYGCRVISSGEKRCPAHQRNKGAELAKGEVLLFLDADTRLPDGFLRNTYAEFKNRGLDAAGFYLKFDSPRFLYKIYNAVYRLLCFCGQYFQPASVGVGIMVRTEFHRRINGFDETVFLGEDYDYTTRISRLGRFRMLNSGLIYFSPRRLEKEGAARVIRKWVKATAYFILKGPIRKKIVEYEFGNYPK